MQRVGQFWHIVDVGDRIFFTAYSYEPGQELWRRDGTEAGTGLASDISPGAASSWPQYLVRSGARVYLAADDGPHGQELWALPRLDGAPTATPPPSRTQVPSVS